MPFLDYWGPEASPSCAESQEIQAILEKWVSDNSYREVYNLVNDQLNVLHSRAVTIFTLCGVVVTVTGFSGRLIASTNGMAQLFIISGLLICILAAANTMLFVMPVRWITSYMHLAIETWLLTAIRRRNRKYRAFRISIFLLIIGLTLYGLAISLMLAYPLASPTINAR